PTARATGTPRTPAWGSGWRSSTSSSSFTAAAWRRAARASARERASRCCCPRRGNELRNGTLRLLRGQAESLQLRIEPHPGDPERARRGRLVALGLREGIRDRVSLELLKGRRRIVIRDGKGRLAGRQLRADKAELGGGDEPAVRNDQRSLDCVLELPDVTGPRVCHQQLPSVAAQPRLPLAHPLAQAADELLGEEHHVLAALAQRRQVNREHAEPVVEIVAELAVRHGVGEVPVGGDDEAKVGLERRGAADALELVLLEDTEKFGLDAR